MNQYANDSKYIEKVRKIYGDLNGELHLVELQRNRASSPLGLSLAGNRDLGTMSVFVIGVQSFSVAGSDGRIHVGDELLEINGHVLYGRSHLNASAIIKGIASSRLKILLLRNKEYMQRMAVEPLKNATIEYKDDYTSTLIPKLTPTSPSSMLLDEIILRESYRSSRESEDNNCENDDDGEEVKKDEDAFHRISSSSSSSSSSNCRTAPEDSSETSTAHINSCDTSSKNNEKSCASMTNNKSPKQNPAPVIKTKLKKTSEVDEVDDEFHALSNTIDTTSCSEPANDRHRLNHAETTYSEISSDSCQIQPDDVIVEDPATCPISSGKPTIISLHKGKQGLGLQVIGGSDTILKSIFVFEIYKGGAVSTDGRLHVGDQILEVNSEDMTSATHIGSLQILRRSSGTVRMTVLRDELAFQEDSLCDDLTVDLFKKPGKGLGISIVSNRDGVGVVISDIVKGGAAEIDGRLMTGDQITSINGEDFQLATQEHAAKLLKTLTGRVSMSVRRLKTGLRPMSLHTSSFVNMYSERVIRKSESQMADYKTAGKHIPKRKPIRYQSVTTCLQSSDD